MTTLRELTTAFPALDAGFFRGGNSGKYDAWLSQAEPFMVDEEVEFAVCQCTAGDDHRQLELTILTRTRLLHFQSIVTYVAFAEPETTLKTQVLLRDVRLEGTSDPKYPVRLGAGNLVVDIPHMDYEVLYEPSRLEGRFGDIKSALELLNPQQGADEQRD